VSKLIIVESPAKAKTIKGFLGKDYNVIASKGHIRDLPKKSFGIKIEDDRFIPQYRVARENAPIVKEIKTLAKNSDIVYIATDEDREGEAIGYHIAYAIGKEPLELPRIVFHEITKKAILHSLENPRKINMNEVDAQQARRLLDRIVGYKLSPLLASKIQKGLSAGRVQSSTLKIIVDKEREIQKFIPIEYHTITAFFNDLETTLIEFDNEKISKLSIHTQDKADFIIDNMDMDFKVANITSQIKKSQSLAPFMTSTLQQGASTRLGYSPKKTMMIAQSLYEGVKIGRKSAGLITYMRTDSLNISKEFQNEARELILNQYGDKYLPENPKIYKSKSKNAQEAHEAIRPTNLEMTPDVVKEYLKPEELKIYSLIYNRFLASQMENPKFESQTILFKSENTTFKANGRKLIFDGYYKVIQYDEKDKLLPYFEIDSSVNIDKLKSKQNFTEPPSRYSEASLIKTLESLGIGRPSTYAPTISLLKNREYIKNEKKQLIPNEIAFKVIKLLEEYFTDIVDSTFTANMEDKLDNIAINDEKWESVLNEFYQPFMEKIIDGKKNIPSQKVIIPIGEECPDCKEELVKRKGRYGEFISCSNFPKCKYTRNIKKDSSANEKTVSKESNEICEKCNSKMIIKVGKNGEFLACSAYPKCKNTKSLNPTVTVDVKCPECNSEILLRNSKRGSFFGCSSYPKCKFISKYKPTSIKCSKCNYLMAERSLKSGDFYECIKCKHKQDK